MEIVGAWPCGHAAMLRPSGVARRTFARLAILFQLVRKLVALVERAYSRALDGGDVHEHVGSAVIGLDEAEPLVELNHFTVPVAMSRSLAVM